MIKTLNREESIALAKFLAIRPTDLKVIGKYVILTLTEKTARVSFTTEFYKNDRALAWVFLNNVRAAAKYHGRTIASSNRGIEWYVRSPSR